jgi:hypothetical protein
MFLQYNTMKIGDYVKVVYLCGNDVKVVKGIFSKEDEHTRLINGLFSPIEIGTRFIIQVTQLERDDNYKKIVEKYND